ncbi:TOBE domain-containing protein [Nordella sp. HKS 07]|uniref:TOBE domain-containing protein n=1 Tax=Nordella sp. HKS 07 TaxID=2712222 RepID=UPI0013E1C2CB|nr:TOBE domain-containing protein [Nordella sp. HKS 07]QIG47229.1 TOBE domain-containing protein [Nordella sp. HKS 07]
MGRKGSDPEMTLPATLINQVFQGSFLKLTFADAAGRQYIATQGDSARSRTFAPGETIDLAWDSDKAVVFDIG